METQKQLRSYHINQNKKKKKNDGADMTRRRNVKIQVSKAYFPR